MGSIAEGASEAIERCIKEVILCIMEFAAAYSEIVFV
jgi:hypothetical protein